MPSAQEHHLHVTNHCLSSSPLPLLPAPRSTSGMEREVLQSNQAGPGPLLAFASSFPLPPMPDTRRHPRPIHTPAQRQGGRATGACACLSCKQRRFLFSSVNSVKKSLAAGIQSPETPPCSFHTGPATQTYTYTDTRTDRTHVLLSSPFERRSRFGKEKASGERS